MSDTPKTAQELAVIEEVARDLGFFTNIGKPGGFRTMRLEIYVPAAINNAANRRKLRELVVKYGGHYWKMRRTEQYGAIHLPEEKMGDLGSGLAFEAELAKVGLFPERITSGFDHYEAKCSGMTIAWHSPANWDVKHPWTVLVDGNDQPFSGDILADVMAARYGVGNAS